MQTDATLLANNSQLFWELLPKLNLPKKKKKRRVNLRFTEKLLLGLKHHNSLEAQSL